MMVMILKRSFFVVACFIMIHVGRGYDLLGTRAIIDDDEKDDGSKKNNDHDTTRYRNSISSDESSSKKYYIFLQKFPLKGTFNLIFHTEVLVCNKQNFNTNDQQYLDSLQFDAYVEIAESFWADKGTVNCIELGYGGAGCTEQCCGVPHGSKQLNYPLNAHRAMIGNADTTKKSLYLYGIGNFDGDTAYDAVCPGSSSSSIATASSSSAISSSTNHYYENNNEKCWSNWSGMDYNPLTNNCNTFTSTVLSCVYGLSEKKPNLGPSDMVNVTCKCQPPPAASLAVKQG